ncbi:MAG: LacI family DNA-binding transcriptional regulator [Bacteroidia bacterium]|nr:LacI family DNA-binding transcriptional regulator [Bacteroidia bacterium]
MGKGRVTIKDIARELGISPSTVSKALKGHPDISSATKKAVKELVEKWNYKPDPIALSLKVGQSRTIGVIVPEIVHYFFSTVISGIEDIAYDSGYNVLFCQSNELYEREVKAVETLLSGRADGILVSLSKVTENFDHFRKIMKAGIPLVFFDRVCDELETDRVIVDDEKGAYDATNHLIHTGCSNIIHLSGPPNLIIGKNRKAGFIRALKEHRIPIRAENIIKCDTAPEARIIVPEILKRTKKPDGIFAVNDLTAAETMKIVKLNGYKVPDDISIIGFTSGMISDLTDPPLTSVQQHGYIVGQEAVNLLIKNIENRNEIPFQTKVIKTELVIKGSTRKVL